MFGRPPFFVNQQQPLRLTICQWAAGVVAPPVCALCGGPGQWLDEPWGLDLCPHCEAACPRLAHPCPRCAAPRSGPGAPCPDCPRAPRAFDAAVALFQYGDPVDQLVTGLKFGRELVHARVLGMLFARRLRDPARPLPDGIVPLPLHAARLAERGFNQSREIARHLAPRLGVPLALRLLARQRDTAAQSTLDAAARARNLQHAFAVTPGARVPARLALLDDVLTTGATADAAARALRAAGARHIEVWACARAARPPA